MRLRVPEQFGTADVHFLETLNSFHTLKPAERKLAEPLKIDTWVVREEDTFKSLAEMLPLNHHREETLRLLNGKYPDGSLTAGEVIKIIR